MNKELREQLLDKLESVGGLRPKAGMTYALMHFSEVARLGIGMSQREIIRATGNPSPFFHDWDTFHEHMGICKEFVRFCLSQGINRLHKLQYGTVEAFLMGKIRSGNQKNTLEVTMCVLQKFFRVCVRRDLHDQLTGDSTRFGCLASPHSAVHVFDYPGNPIAKISTREQRAVVTAKRERLTG